MQAIGIFDSGLGGISILRQAMEAMPGERFLYYGDCENAPYGCRTEQEIRDLSLAACRKIAASSKALLVACNTATAASLPALREAFSDIPVIGIHPAIHEAVDELPTGRILMLATEATVGLSSYHALHAALPDPSRVVNIAGPAELVRRVERGIVGAADFDDILEPLFAPFAGERIAGIVLGCTHYPFLLPALRRHVAAHFAGECRFFDGGRQSVLALLAQLRARGIAAKGFAGSVDFLTSGDLPRLQPLFERLLHMPL